MLEHNMGWSVLHHQIQSRQAFFIWHIQVHTMLEVGRQEREERSNTEINNFSHTQFIYIQNKLSVYIYTHTYIHKKIHYIVYISIYIFHFTFRVTIYTHV